MAYTHFFLGEKAQAAEVFRAVLRVEARVPPGGGRETRVQGALSRPRCPTSPRVACIYEDTAESMSRSKVAYVHLPFVPGWQGSPEEASGCIGSRMSENSEAVTVVESKQ